MKRYCICVFWDKNGIVRDYFIYYLKALKEVCSEIMVVANGKLSESGRKMLTELGVTIMQRENNGLDFGAWKVAINKIGYEKLSEHDELILTNNTCYGPIFPFSEVFNEMEKRDCNFWGITKHPSIDKFMMENNKRSKIIEHIQSYFLVFNKNIIQSKAFKNYWKTLKLYNDYKNVVGYYETKLTKYFEDNGFKSDSYVNLNVHKNAVNNPQCMTLRLLKEASLPLVKRKAICDKYNSVYYNTLADQATAILEYLSDKFDINMIYQDILGTQPMSAIKTNLNLNFVLQSKYCSDFTNKNEKIALILYIYYEDLIEYCYNYAKSMPEGSDIYIISSKKEVLDYCKAHPLDGYNVEYRLKENRGRDVSAYLIACKDIFQKYDLVCCMHDKKSSAVNSSVGEDFSYHNFECNLKSKEYVKNVIATFDKNPKLGMLCPPSIETGYMSTIGREICSTNNYNELIKLYKQLNLSVPFDYYTPAPFGAMFWIRGKAIEPLFRHDWKYDDFPQEPLSKDGTISHAIERIYPSIVQEAGYFSGWIMPEDYASYYINILHIKLSEERCKTMRLFLFEKIFSIINIKENAFKQKQIMIFGKKFIINKRENV